MKFSRWLCSVLIALFLLLTNTRAVGMPAKTLYRYYLPVYVSPVVPRQINPPYPMPGTADNIRGDPCQPCYCDNRRQP